MKTTSITKLEVMPKDTFTIIMYVALESLVPNHTQHSIKDKSTDHGLSQIYLTNITRGYFTRVIGVLQSVHRAVLTSPEPIPNIEFTLFSVDKVHNVTGWALTRASDDVETWLMPDFGYFSWPENKISSYNHVQRRAREMEEGSPHSGPEQKAYPWKDKTPKLVWRGSEGPKGAPRRALVSAAKDQPWGDALPIHWDPKQGHVNVISMADHCRWKYVAHTEGVSYSGRLKYLQNCRSVVVSHRLTWRTHAMHLMRSTPGPQQNFVEVQPDYTDLGEKMAWLLADDKRAERIADNSARVFRDRYLSPAAEVCYWRKLFRAWASVSEEAWPWVERNGTTEYKGVPVEDYFLMHKLDWEQH